MDSLRLDRAPTLCFDIPGQATEPAALRQPRHHGQLAIPNMGSVNDISKLQFIQPSVRTPPHFSLDDVCKPAAEESTLSGERASAITSAVLSDRLSAITCNLPRGMWLLSIGPIDGNWANQDSVAVLWASRQASESMFGLPDVNMVGFPIDPNPADIFHLPNASRWRPFGGDGDCGTLFRMTTKAIAITRTRILLVCLDLDVFSGPLMDFSAIVQAFHHGYLRPQLLRGTELGPGESLPQGEPSPAQRRYGFRLWMRKLNIAPEIRALVGDNCTLDGFDPSKISISSSWYLVSHIHILQMEDDDNDALRFLLTESNVPTTLGSTTAVAGCLAGLSSPQPDASIIPASGTIQAQDNHMNQKVESQPDLSDESRDDSCRNSRGYFFIPSFSHMSAPLPSLGQDLPTTPANAIASTS